MSKKPSITQSVLEQYREHYGWNYDENQFLSIRSMTTFISTNASRIKSGSKVYHPFPMTYKAFFYNYTKNHYPDRYGMFSKDAVPVAVQQVMEIVWIVMKVWHPEYPWMDGKAEDCDMEDDRCEGKEPVDKELMKDDREDEWEP